MRFTFVLPVDEYFTPGWSGAVATVTRQLVTELGLMGHECVVLAPDDGEDVYPDAVRDATGLRAGTSTARRGPQARQPGGTRARPPPMGLRRLLVSGPTGTRPSPAR